ncbi:hypothetical protein SESBI_48271 [Sesbania bispinosa]|nr:hypothetical protein SESBI_48271 [Sesbania bispinosa]
MDSAALLSAMNEIQKLKLQLEKAREYEATLIDNTESANAEIQDLRKELDETLSLVEKLKNEVSHYKESESRALEIVGKTQMQLEAANKTVEMQDSTSVEENNGGWGKRGGWVLSGEGKG